MSETTKPAINTRMPKGAKRPKSSRACLACRKLKARCEPAREARMTPTQDPQSSTTTASFVICHRCKTLCIDCLYEVPSGEVVKGEQVQVSSVSPSPADDYVKPSSSKRSRQDVHNAPARDDLGNDRAIFLSPAISPSPLTRSIYRDVEISSLNTAPISHLERPVLAANALSRLIGAKPALKKQAQEYILSLSGASEASSPHSWKQAPPDLCAGKAAIRLMLQQKAIEAFPKNEVDYLTRFLQPYELHLKTLFQGLYGPFTPFLSTPFEDTLGLSSFQSEAQCFLLLTIYLAALPHLESTHSAGQAKKPLRKAVDTLLRRALHTPLRDHLNIFALHNCASLLLIPVDGLVEDCRPVHTSEQEEDGLLEFASDLNPRAAIITALTVAHRLGYADLASRLPSLRQSFESDSPQEGSTPDTLRDEYAHAVLCTFTWLTLLQFRASIDVAEDRIEWEALAQFEKDIPRVRIDTLTAALMPPPSFLSPREQSRCCWMAQRAELYGIARDHRHLKRAAASFTKKEAEKQSLSYKKALDAWRYKFNEQMRSMSMEFHKDDRGLRLHRFYSVFSNAEAASLQSCIGSVYHKELVADLRQRLPEPFFRDNIPWKSAATILLGHDNDRITKSILINFAFVDATLKALGLISTLTPVMPQLYDFVAYEESAGSEIPSLCIVAPPTVQAGLFAVPLLVAADLRLSVIEAWGASASYFNHHLTPLLTNCVKSLRACHVRVDLPGVLKIPYTTANPMADYLQGPFEILMRKVVQEEERLQISHVESILQNSFILLSNKKRQTGAIADELAPEVPEMVQDIADSHRIEEEITASMMGSLNVEAIEEVGDTDFAIRMFGSDVLEGDVRPVRKMSSGPNSYATTPDADGHRISAVHNKSGSVERDQADGAPALMGQSKQEAYQYRGVRSGTHDSRYSSPNSSIQSGPNRQHDNVASGVDGQPAISHSSIPAVSHVSPAQQQHAPYATSAQQPGHNESSRNFDSFPSHGAQPLAPSHFDEPHNQGPGIAGGVTASGSERYAPFQNTEQHFSSEGTLHIVPNGFEGGTRGPYEPTAQMPPHLQTHAAPSYASVQVHGTATSGHYNPGFAQANSNHMPGGAHFTGPDAWSQQNPNLPASQFAGAAYQGEQGLPKHQAQTKYEHFSNASGPNAQQSYQEAPNSTGFVDHYQQLYHPAHQQADGHSAPPHMHVKQEAEVVGHFTPPFQHQVQDHQPPGLTMWQAWSWDPAQQQQQQQQQHHHQQQHEQQHHYQQHPQHQQHFHG